MALEAYRRALETGKTFDRRIKIVLIGQDRVGKTSLRKHLRGEAFNKDEASTPGIEMISPVKNAGKGAWKNPAPLEKTSALDHKSAKLVTQALRNSSEERPQRVQPFAGEVKNTGGEPSRGKGVTQEHSNDDLVSKEVIERNGKVKLTIALTLTSFFTDSRYLSTTREVIGGGKKRQHGCRSRYTAKQMLAQSIFVSCRKNVTVKFSSTYITVSTPNPSAKAISNIKLQRIVNFFVLVL